MKSVQIRSFFWSAFSYIQIYRVNLRILAEYRKKRTRKNSVFGHFSRSVNATKNEDFHRLFGKIDRLHQKIGVHLDACNYLKCTLLFLNQIHKAKKKKKLNNNQVDLKVTFCVSEVTTL